METVLVTAGAGFIGSHICKALAAYGFLPVAFNDLSRGHADFVRWGPLVNGTSRLQSMFGMCVVSPVLDGSGADVRRVSVLRWTRSAQRRCMLSASTVKHWTAQVLPPRPACMGRPIKPRINHDPVKLLDRSSSRHYPWRSASKPAHWHQYFASLYGVLLSIAFIIIGSRSFACDRGVRTPTFDKYFAEG
jgi:hypothetical protein